MSQMGIRPSYFILFSFVVCNAPDSTLDARNIGIWDQNNHILKIALLNSSGSTQDIPIICYTIYR
jgi:hypothetical protein